MSTTAQLANLETLADYLEKLRTPFFDMSAYEYDCGSPSCALAHGPRAGLPRLAEEAWTVYASRIFGLSTHAWCWCFVGDWARHDNTAKGAAQRIRHYLEDGVPRGWERPGDRVVTTPLECAGSDLRVTEDMEM